MHFPSLCRRKKKYFKMVMQGFLCRHFFFRIFLSFFQKNKNGHFYVVYQIFIYLSISCRYFFRFSEWRLFPTFKFDQKKVATFCVFFNIVFETCRVLFFVFSLKFTFNAQFLSQKSPFFQKIKIIESDFITYV